MSTNPPAAPPRPLALTWIWFIFLGLVCTLLGVIGAIDLTVTEFLSAFGVLLFGFLFLIAGGVQIVGGLFVRPWPSAVLQVLCGILYGVAGSFAISEPKLATSIFTLLLAIALILGGAVRVVLAFQHLRTFTWIALAFGGILTMFVGAYILLGWPGDSVWVIGMFFALDLIFQGFSWLAMGANLRALDQAIRAGVHVEITDKRK